MPIEATGAAHTAGLTDGYSTTPVIVAGMVYTQDLDSNVMAIRLATGKVAWVHYYGSPNGGPDGVNVAGGTVYAATNHAVVALSAATGKQLWSRTLTQNDHEGIDMAPGYHDGTVYVSTVPVSPTVGQYLGGRKGILWALNARTGATRWTWDEVQSLWGNPAINSGCGLWEPPSFDAQGNLYLGIANPGPIGEAGWPRGYPWGTSRPGPDLYTDSVVKLSPQGKLLWYYQLIPHDLYVSGMAETSRAFAASVRTATGEMVAVSQDTGKIIWDDKLPSTPYGAATVTNNVVFTTTFSGYLYAFNTATGAILLKTPCPRGPMRLSPSAGTTSSPGQASRCRAGSN